MLPTQYLRDLITIPYFFEAQSESATQKKKNLWALKKKSHATINVVCVCRSKYGRNATYTRRRIHSSTSRAIFRSGLFISIGVSLNPCDDTRRCERQIVSRIYSHQLSIHFRRIYFFGYAALQHCRRNPHIFSLPTTYLNYVTRVGCLSPENSEYEAHFGGWKATTTMRQIKYKTDFVLRCVYFLFRQIERGSNREIYTHFCWRRSSREKQIYVYHPKSVGAVLLYAQCSFFGWWTSTWNYTVRRMLDGGWHSSILQKSLMLASKHTHSVNRGHDTPLERVMNDQICLRIIKIHDLYEEIYIYIILFCCRLAVCIMHVVVLRRFAACWTETLLSARVRLCRERRAQPWRVSTKSAIDFSGWYTTRLKRIVIVHRRRRALLGALHTHKCWLRDIGVQIRAAFQIDSNLYWYIEFRGPCKYKYFPLLSERIRPLSTETRFGFVGKQIHAASICKRIESAHELANL